MNFHWHKWRPWSDPIPTLNTGHKQQWRSCQICNKAQFRTLDWDKQSNPTDVIAALEKSCSVIGITGEQK